MEGRQPADRCAGRRRTGEAMRAGLRTTIVLVLADGACRAAPPGARTAPTSRAAAPRPARHRPRPSRPEVGSCHALSFAQTRPDRWTRVIPSRARSRTPPRRSRSARLAALADGHLLAVDSPAVQAQAGEDLSDGAAGLPRRGPDHPAAQPDRRRLVRTVARAGRRRCRLVPLRRRRAPQGQLAHLAAADDEGRARPARRAGPLRHLRHRCPRRASSSSGSSARRSTPGARSTSSTCRRRPATWPRTQRPPATRPARTSPRSEPTAP